MVEILTEDRVEWWSQCTREIHGDSVVSPKAVVYPDTVKLSCRPNDLKDLKATVDRLSDESKRVMTIRYGWIIHLLYVPMQLSLVRALINFWDPGYKCFTFGGHDLTPTLEEYHQLLNIPFEDDNRLYVHNKDEHAWRQLARMIGRKSDDIEDWRIGSDFDTRKMLAFANENHGNNEGLQMIALLIYGLVLFPTQKGKVDSKVIIYFTKVSQRRKGVNPVIGILAETFRSLDKCRVSGGRFEGCTQLLCIWALSHLRCPRSFGYPDPKYGKAYNPARNYINDFAQAKWPAVGPSKDGWVEFLKQIKEENIQWQAKWNVETEVIFMCGTYLWVPLLGPWGGIGYGPCMVRRQFGARQFIPVTAGLKQSSFNYGEHNTKGKILNIAREWGKVKKIDRAKVAISADATYLQRIQSRVRGYVVLEQPVTDKEIINRLQKRVMELEASNQWVSAERDRITEDSQFYLDTMSVKVQEYDDEIRKLKEANYFYEQERSITDEQIVKATEMLRTAVARAGDISMELTKMRAGLVVADAQGARLSEWSNDLIKETAHYGEYV